MSRRATRSSTFSTFRRAERTAGERSRSSATICISGGLIGTDAGSFPQRGGTGRVYQMQFVRGTNCSGYRARRAVPRSPLHHCRFLYECSMGAAHDNSQEVKRCGAALRRVARLLVVGLGTDHERRVLSFPSTSSITDFGALHAISALRVLQSRLLIWSERMTPVTSRSEGSATSKG